MSYKGIDLRQIETELKGKTLQVYWYLLKTNGTRAVGVREIQRALGFSSPSVAQHHLGKLQDLGLAQKNELGEYFLVEEVKVGLLRFFVRLGWLFMPRYLFYAVMFTTMLVLYVLLFGLSGSAHNIAALLFGVSAVMILWYETLRIWLEKPF